MATKGLLVLRAMRILGLEKQSDISPLSPEEMQAELDEVSLELLRYFNHRPAYDSIASCHDVLTDHRSVQLCFCEGTVGNNGHVLYRTQSTLIFVNVCLYRGFTSICVLLYVIYDTNIYYKFIIDQLEMIECGNTECTHGRWFHYGCVTDRSSSGGNWFCSDICAASGSANICICRTVRADELLKCKAGDKCERGEYFHKGCVPQLETTIEGEFEGHMVVNLCHCLIFLD